MYMRVLVRVNVIIDWMAEFSSHAISASACALFCVVWPHYCVWFLGTSMLCIYTSVWGVRTSEWCAHTNVWVIRTSKWL